MAGRSQDKTIGTANVKWGQAMASTAFADVNGDGYADAIVNNLRGDVTVRPSNGTTTFTGLTDHIPERLGGSHESD